MGNIPRGDCCSIKVREVLNKAVEETGRIEIGEEAEAAAHYSVATAGHVIAEADARLRKDGLDVGESMRLAGTNLLIVRSTRAHIDEGKGTVVEREAVVIAEGIAGPVEAQKLCDLMRDERRRVLARNGRYRADGDSHREYYADILGSFKRRKRGRSFPRRSRLNAKSVDLTTRGIWLKPKMIFDA